MSPLSEPDGQRTRTFRGATCRAFLKRPRKTALQREERNGVERMEPPGTFGSAARNFPLPRLCRPIPPLPFCSCSSAGLCLDAVGAQEACQRGRAPYLGRTGTVAER